MNAAEVLEKLYEYVRSQPEFDCGIILITLDNERLAIKHNLSKITVAMALVELLNDSHLALREVVQ